MAGRPGYSDIQGLPVFEKVGVVWVGVVVVEDKDVLIPTWREDQELSCLVGVWFGSLGVDIDDDSELVVGAMFLNGVDFVKENLMVLSATNILLLLIEVAFYREWGFW